MGMVVQPVKVDYRLTGSISEFAFRRHVMPRCADGEVRNIFERIERRDPIKTVPASISVHF